MEKVNIVGAGLAGLSAAVTLAKQGYPVRLISAQPSERAQSVLAEGGINAALDTMEEQDRIEYHYEDTMRGGCDLADPEAVHGLTRQAPEVVQWLAHLGVPFHREGEKLILRNFGGQSKKRTAYAKSSTGKVIMTALIDAVRQFEVAGIVERYMHHELVQLLMEKEDESGQIEHRCLGVRVADHYKGEILEFQGPVILAVGGLSGVFPGMTTGTVQNTGDVAAMALAQGVVLSNLEMIQYHPTTFAIPSKRCLVSEAARGEGGRLFVMRGGKPWYFMEEKYPELKNLMPRDVVSREMYFAVRQEGCGEQVYLDMTGLSKEVWKRKLSDLREEIQHYMGKDPVKEPIPVEPGIHYFMGGIDVDVHHGTNVPGLYAAGECTSQYHGANRLGGNSMLGAIYGGKTAALQIIREWEKGSLHREGVGSKDQGRLASLKSSRDVRERLDERQLIKGEQGSFEKTGEKCSPQLIYQIRDILAEGMGIVRTGARLSECIRKLEALEAGAHHEKEQNRLLLAKAMLYSAYRRTESRGAHFREDYPERDKTWEHLQKVQYRDGRLWYDGAQCQ